MPRHIHAPIMLIITLVNILAFAVRTYVWDQAHVVPYSNGWSILRLLS